MTYLEHRKALLAEIAYCLEIMFPAPVQIEFAKTEHVQASWIGPSLLAIEVSTAGPIAEAEYDESLPKKGAK